MSNLAKLPPAVRHLVESFERLPGIGPKSAQRLVFYLLHMPETELDKFAQRLQALKRETVLCSVCHNVSQHDPCEICRDKSRDSSLLCIVEQPLDVLALENAQSYLGFYHILHGKLLDEIYRQGGYDRRSRWQGPLSRTKVPGLAVLPSPGGKDRHGIRSQNGRNGLELQR